MKTILAKAEAAARLIAAAAADIRALSDVELVQLFASTRTTTLGEQQEAMEAMEPPVPSQVELAAAWGVGPEPKPRAPRKPKKQEAATSTPRPSLGPNEEKVLSALPETVRGVANATGIGSKCVSATLARLLAKGLVQRPTIRGDLWTAA